LRRSVRQERIHGRKFVGRKEMNVRLSALRGVVLSTVFCGAVAFPPSATFANGDNIACPPEWAEYVAIVAEIIVPLGEEPPILFVSREGGVHDCLGLIRDDQFIEQASAYLRHVPYDRSPINLSDSANWPINVCTVGRMNLPHVPFFYSVGLPMEREILALPICRIRVTNSIKHFLGVNQ
jgi:hypothetical protein